MKYFKIIAIVFAAIFVFNQGSFAQEGMEDVVYLKNGNVYRGIIIEQVPGESIKIKTIGGNVFSVMIADLQKITKEDKIEAPKPPRPEYGNHDYTHKFFYNKGDSTRQQFPRKKRGYFCQSQLLIEAVQGGVRIVNGYRFNRFAQLGVGIGADFVIASPTELFRNIDGDGFRGNYLPLYLYFAGDVLKTKVTPFYAFEAGYAWRVGGGGDFPFGGGFNSSNIRGGIMGGAGLGVRFNTKRKVNFSLLLNANFKNIRYNERYETFDVNGNPVIVERRVRQNLIIPGLRFGIGF